MPTTIAFTECFNSVFDDLGNEYSYGISQEDENGKVIPFTDDDVIILKFKDKTETLYLENIAEDLGMQ